MSLSAQLKDLLVEHFGTHGVETSARQWKRRSKTSIDDRVVRRFENADAGLSCLVVTIDEDDDDVEDACVWETGPVGFAIRPGTPSPLISFTPMSHWERSRSWPSLDDYWHPERAIDALPLRHCGDDAGDNLFAIAADRAEDIRRELIAQGYVDLTQMVE